MRLKSALLALALTLGLAAPVAAETYPYAPGTPLYRHVLPNGLTVLMVPLKDSPVVTFHAWVGSGARDEKPGITGIAHLFEHMMFRPVHPGEKSYFDKAAALGLTYNASTRFNSTDFWDTFTPEVLPQVVAMESHRFRELHVTPAMLNLEREAVRSEYAVKFDSNPMIDLWFWIYRYAFPNHPYGWHIVGFREDLDRITADDCNRFFQANYVPNNVMLALAGAFDPNRAYALIQQDFGPWARGPLKKRWSNVPALGTRPVEGPGKLKAPTKYILIGYRIPDRTASDRLAQDLTNSILFDGPNSLVAKRLVETKKLASEADAFNTAYDIGLAKALVVPNPGVSRARIEQEVQSAIASFSTLPDADFKAYRQAYAVNLRESQLKTHDLTSALGHAWAYDGDFRNAYLDAQNVLNVPRSAVAAVIRKTYKPTNRVTAYTP